MKNKITLIAGLPCSGKTTLLNTLSGYNIDDIVSLDQLTKDKVLKQDLNITSPHFIFKDVREKAILKLKEIYGEDVIIDMIFFENNPQKCLLNLEKRGDNKIKDVKKFIINFTKNYDIPNGVVVKNINI